MTNIFIFKSNIDCNCKLKIISQCLSSIKEIEQWSIDSEDCDKVLRIVCNNISICSVENHILKSGLIVFELKD